MTGLALDPDPERTRALAILRRHGWSTVSFQLLEPAFRYWFDGDSDAFVAYIDTGAAWVAGGAPVGPRERLAEIAARFVAAARLAGRRVSFFACEEPFVRAAGWRSLHVGEQPVWRAGEWPQVLAGARSLRYQLRRALHKGVRVERLVAEDVGRRRVAIDALARDWLATRGMIAMGFLVQLEPLMFADERVLFTAEHDGVLVGLLSAVPVYARRRWFIEDLLRTRRAPNGTIELLIDAAMTAPEVAGSEGITLGLAPLAGTVSKPLRLARAITRPLYDFRGLHAFKRKLRPHSWEPVYLCTPGLPWVALMDALKAFAGGSLLGFAFRTLLRAPRRAMLTSGSRPS